MLQIEADRMDLLNITDSCLVASKKQLKVEGGAVYGTGMFNLLKNIDNTQEERSHPYSYSEFGEFNQIDTLSVATIKAYQKKYTPTSR